MSDVAKQLEKAEKYLQKGKPEAALREYLEILQQEPAQEIALTAAADLYATLGSPKEAAGLLARLLQRQLDGGEDTKAPITYKKLARFGPPSPEQSLRCAQLLQRSNKKEALEIYKTALRAFTDGHRKPEALSVVEAIVALDPSAEHYRQRGEVAAALGEKPLAAASFLKAGELEAHDKPESAFACFERAHLLEPSNPAITLIYARALLARHAVSNEQNDVAVALEILEPLAAGPGAATEVRATYAEALLAAGRGVAAEPYVWDLFQREPQRMDRVFEVIGALLDANQTPAAVHLAQKLEKYQGQSGNRREYVAAIQEVGNKHEPRLDFLEYLVEVFNSCSREHDYCDTLLKLFDLYYAGGNFRKAGDCLDRAAEVDPYDAGHSKRLDSLRGKIDGNALRMITGRLSGAKGADARQEPAAEIDNQPTILEDLMLQAEIFLQYSMRTRAVERLERVRKLFPGEELKNAKLRTLYLAAGMTPAEAPPPAPAAAAVAETVALAAAPPPPPVARAVADESAVDNIAVVTEITRNIYRQANIKSVLFTGIHEVGRHWNASRSIAVLCVPGKPPSIALEYCAPGIKQSDVLAIVKLIGLLQPLIIAHGPLVISADGTPGWALPLKQFATTMQIESLLAVPMIEGDEHTGLLLLAQCGGERTWRATDTVVLKTIADQMVLAVANVRLRSLVKNLAITDEKSGLLKRASYLDVLLSETRRALQQNLPVTVMLMHFGKGSELIKQFGESAVESMMQQAGQIVCAHIRQNDLAIRYDLTTLAVVLADTNDKHAFFAVDKLRKVMANVRAPGAGATPPITVGIAEAVMQPGYDPADVVTEVINRVEAALEMALKEGGNKAQSLAPALENAAMV